MVNGLYLYGGFLVLLTTQSALHYTHIHPLTQMLIYWHFSTFYIHTHLYNTGNLGFSVLPKDTFCFSHKQTPGSWIGFPTSCAPVLNVRAPKGCVLSLLLFLLETMTAFYSHKWNFTVRVADNIATISPITTTDENSYGRNQQADFRKKGVEDTHPCLHRWSWGEQF